MVEPAEAWGGAGGGDGIGKQRGRIWRREERERIQRRRGAERERWWRIREEQWAHGSGGVRRSGGGGGVWSGSGGGVGRSWGGGGVGRGGGGGVGRTGGGGGSSGCGGGEGSGCDGGKEWNGREAETDRDGWVGWGCGEGSQIIKGNAKQCRTKSKSASPHDHKWRMNVFILEGGRRCRRAVFSFYFLRMKGHVASLLEMILRTGAQTKDEQGEGA
uniref:Uncharacterized protein n=1 Tax=Setaria viridis TaxID=4556 RepID=A0A4U6VEX0_SETVI|nr:hypothetical protein SEVIR_3G239600v2 [Setaria viridis]